MTTAASAARHVGPAQSLARGEAGTALLRIEQALNGTGAWRDAHAVITQIASAPLDGSTRAGLFYGAPTLAFVLHTATTDGQPRYQAARDTLGGHVHRIAWQRLAEAQARMARGDLATFAEYDLFYGLTGLAALLLRTAPGSDTLAGILRYLIELTRLHAIDGQALPGWWADHDPDPLLPTPGGHANLGMAHGAAGILALLSLAAIRGRTVDGQHSAIEYLCSWFGRWRQETGDGPWWPQWITRDDLRAGRPAQHGPGRPSWCYGTPGIARALQLAAIAMGDTARQAAAEHALAACLPGNGVAWTGEPGLCHGIAGLYQTAARAARDARTPAISLKLPPLAAALAQHAVGFGQPGLLTGDAGTGLALQTLRHATAPCSGWDACLLIT